MQITSSKEWLHRLAKRFLLDKDPAQGKKLAEILGCPTSDISRQRSGQIELNTEQIKKISAFLEIPMIIIVASVNYEKCMRQEKFEEAEQWKSLFIAHSKTIVKSPENKIFSEKTPSKKTKKHGETSNKVKI